MLFMCARSSARNARHGGGCNHTRHVSVIFICIWHDSVCSNVTTTTLCRKTLGCPTTTVNTRARARPQSTVIEKVLSYCHEPYRPSCGIYPREISICTSSGCSDVFRCKYTLFHVSKSEKSISRICRIKSSSFFLLIKRIFNIANKPVDR